MVGLEARPSFLGDTFPETRRFLWFCDYRFLPLLRKDLIPQKNLKRGQSATDSQVRLIKNLNPSYDFPRFGLIITPINGFQQMEVNLHKDARRHRLDKKASQEIAKEGQRILGQLATFKPLSPELKVFEKALGGFLLFGAGEAIRKEQEVKGSSYYKAILNKRHRQHRKSREGQRRKALVERTREPDWDAY